MTTDRPRLVLTLVCVLLAWLLVLILAMFIPKAAPASLVVGPATLLDRLPNALLLDRGWLTVTLTGVSAAEIYRAGGWLVLPAGLPLCVAPDRAPRQTSPFSGV